MRKKVFVRVGKEIEKEEFDGMVWIYMCVRAMLCMVKLETDSC